MKVSRIPDYISRGVAATGIITGIVIAYNQHNQIKDDLVKIKKEIKTKAPQKFEEINNKYKPKNRYADFSFWYQQNKQLDESLKMDSIIQKAYFEGAQMVRDSIANAK